MRYSELLLSRVVEQGRGATGDSSNTQTRYRRRSGQLQATLLRQCRDGAVGHVLEADRNRFFCNPSHPPAVVLLVILPRERGL